MKSATRAPLLLSLALSALVALPEGAARGEPSAVTLIRGVPHVQQKPDFCGEACVAMALGKLGFDADQDYVFDQSGLDPLLGRGLYTRELVQAARKIGFETGPVWYKVDAAAPQTGLLRQLAALRADLARGIPSVVCMHYDDSPQTTEHFRLVLGYDADRSEVIYHEPAAASGSYRRMAAAEFLTLWPLKYDRDEWTVVRMRLEPKAVRVDAARRGRTAADYAQHVMELKKTLPPGFSLALSPPFVVVGDERPDVVEKRAESTVKWATERLKAEYFTKDPNEIIDVWLFEGRQSYERYTRELFGDRPSTPYGYYSPAHHALIMNIATGGGTLVHEMVHPFVHANFPDAPAWLNEGLGSLYEQCGERNGRIWGFTNWRLAGLQEAIAEGAVPSFRRLTATTDFDFYERDPGTNYAQARYLCMYLQDNGLLKRFYADFLATKAKDPTGLAALERALGTGDMAAFQRQWQAWVMGLRFP